MDMAGFDKFFTRDPAQLKRVQADLTDADVKTVGDFIRFAQSFRRHDVGRLLLYIANRLTGHKVKADGRRDGKWIWENIQAGLGRRVTSLKHPLDNRFVFAVENLIVLNHQPDSLWELKRIGSRHKLRLLLIRKPNRPHGLALDIMKLLGEHLKLPDECR